jgi:hypothetical protein
MVVDRQLSEFLRFLCVIKYRIASSFEEVKKCLGTLPLSRCAILAFDKAIW